MIANKCMLTLQPQEPLGMQVDVFQILPERFLGMSLDQIRRQPIFVGNQETELGQIFSVSGDASDQHHVWIGDLGNVCGIGHGMKHGWIQVQGDAGNHLGSQIRGGTIQVAGNTGDFTGAEMKSGLIHIRGNVGNSAGAACDAGQAGQHGGAILVEGSAGDSLGRSMRRGVIAVGGNVGQQCGYCMRAGSIVVAGSAGAYVGCEMTRGTIVLGQGTEHFPPGFSPAGRHAMPVVTMLNRYLRQLGFPLPLPSGSFQLCHGDRLRGSRGEILIGG